MVCNQESNAEHALPLSKNRKYQEQSLSQKPIGIFLNPKLKNTQLITLPEQRPTQVCILLFIYNRYNKSNLSRQTRNFQVNKHKISRFKVTF
ncbi:hypothetical protein CDL12_19356 [Handroanthus impetiginosus]|uniref:Uncharacterized protein n=1 Tax=Handroanthus impetiginosus TaxID=429701 RepID=A0A2G9GRX7_9LAMI|nr:hypothetical protein CDL12_19356 [Handroanthus impetiginosus]